MGCTVREKDGAWWVFVHHEGRRKAKRIGPGEQGRKAAKAVAGKIGGKLALGDFGILDRSESPVAIPTFAEVSAQWERMTSPNWKQGTKITYGNALRCRLLPTFGGLPITEVTPARVEEWWTTTREGGLSRRRLDILRRILREVCRRAVRLALLKTNPVEYIEGPLGRQDKEIRKGDYLNAEDLTHFLAVAERVCPNEYPIFQVMAMGGLRIGEAVGLQVGDLDVPGLQVHIRRAVRRGYVSSPKNGKGRVVDIPTSTVAVLARVREVRQVEGAYQGVEARWLFPGRTADMPMPSSPGDFHPEALTDPYVTVSSHTARATHRRLPPSADPGELLPLPVGPGESVE